VIWVEKIDGETPQEAKFFAPPTREERSAVMPFDGSDAIRGDNILDHVVACLLSRLLDSNLDAWSG